METRLVSSRRRQQLDSKRVLGRVFGEQFEVVGGKPAVLAQESVVVAKGKLQLDSDRVQNPHDPEATYAVKGQGSQKKERVGYSARCAV